VPFYAARPGRNRDSVDDLKSSVVVKCMGAHSYVNFAQLKRRALGGSAFGGNWSEASPTSNLLESHTTGICPSRFIAQVDA
jgi:hypothetical protein